MPNVKIQSTKDAELTFGHWDLICQLNNEIGLPGKLFQKESVDRDVIPVPAYAGINSGGNPGCYKVNKEFYVYIMASKRNGTLYIGVTSDLVKRTWEHKNKMIEGFTKQYKVDRLVYYEAHSSPESAILKEKRMKKWRRDWKKRLIEEKNPEWKDLYNDIVL
jgi:putative endonuclease